MPVLNYTTADLSRRVNWRLRYIIGTLVIAPCHFVGSLLFYSHVFAEQWWIWKGFGPPGHRDLRVDLARLFIDVYEFPFGYLPEHCPTLPVDPLDPYRNFVIFAAIDGVLWGLCIIGLWQVGSELYRRCVNAGIIVVDEKG